MQGNFELEHSSYPISPRPLGGDEWQLWDMRSMVLLTTEVYSRLEAKELAAQCNKDLRDGMDLQDIIWKRLH